MKKNILIIGMALPLLAGAADFPRMVDGENLPLHLKYEPEMYTVKISPNGNWLGSMAGSAMLYNVVSGEAVSFEEAHLGLGNCIANSGMAVGDLNDTPAVFLNGKMIVPEVLNEHYFADFNAVTPDASRVVGIMNNLERNGVMYVPFIADIT